MKPLTRAQARKYQALLEQTFLFRGIPSEGLPLMLLRPGVFFEQYPADAVLLFPSPQAPRLHILLDGKALVTKRAGGQIVRMSELNPGALYGMATLFSAGAAYPTTIQAQKRCAVLCMEEAVLHDLFVEDVRVMDNYLRYLTGRIHFLNGRIEGFIHPQAKSRVLLYLEQNARDGSYTGGLTALAQALGISRATLYRALDALEEENAIRRNGRRVELAADPLYT